MATARLRRVLAGVRPGIGAPHRASASGGFDRTHDGLVSGWFTCPACGTPPTSTPDLILDGQPLDAAKTTTPRGDVLGGLGFLLRFTPNGRPNAHVRVQCPLHPDEGLDLDVPPGTWATPALAAIEYSTWPMITGWLALLAARDGAIRLFVDGYDPIPVRTTVRRPDVQAYLGTRGVGGFYVDLGALLGYALPDTTTIRLVLNDKVLADAAITDSPLGGVTAGCLPVHASTALDDATVHDLRRRFRDTGVDTGGDWRDILDRLGQREHSAETEAWADYLTHHGQTPQQVSAWLAVRATRALGVPALNPLPADLDSAIDPSDASLPERVRTWTEPILGIGDRATAYDDVSAPPDDQRPDLSGMKVAVAGLVHHKSGLGQNAENSLKALELAGIHACAAPFFPARGGWNPRLGPSKDAIHALEDHTVLLHLPIDQVIPSLAAQPALMRTDRLIGYFMWETEAVPGQYVRALTLVDEIWTGSRFVADSLGHEFGGPIHVVGHVVDTSSVESVARSELGVRDEDFIVHFAFDAHSSVSRKNPVAALRAFDRAFQGDPGATLLLKVRNFNHLLWQAERGDVDARNFLSELKATSNVRLLTDEESRARTLGILAMANCYLSLHRAEGFGYGVAEALSLGVPTVATDYSGVSDFFEDACGWPIAHSPAEVVPGQYVAWSSSMEWAEPDIDLAAQALREVHAGGLEVQQRVQAGQQMVKNRYSLAATAGTYAWLLSGQAPVSEDRRESSGRGIASEDKA